MALSVDHFERPVLPSARKDFARILVQHTVGQALAHLRESLIEGQVVYFYVVDELNRLHGVVPTRALLLSPAETPVADIMLRNVVKLSADATLMDACELFIMHRLMALPIVDAQGRILGVVDVSLYTDEVTDLADRQSSDDVFALIGVRLAQVRRAGVFTLFRRRFPWLLCNITGGLACAFLASLFTGILEQVIILALFIPVVLALAESVSIQSLTLTLQIREGRRLEWSALGRSLVREAPVGVLIGLAAGAMVALVAWIWKGCGQAALCMVCSIALAVATAALLGMGVPAILDRMRRNAELASGPIVLALTDVVTLFYYLGLAAWWLR